MSPIFSNEMFILLECFVMSTAQLCQGIVHRGISLESSYELYDIIESLCETQAISNCGQV